MTSRGIERDLEQQIAKLEEGTTDQILEYLALITGEYHVVTTPPSEVGGRLGFAVTFRAVNEDLGIEFLAMPDGQSATIRDAAMFAAKGALAWYQPWKEAGGE